MTTMSLPRAITPTERQIVELLWADKRVHEIAKLLDVEIATVRSHIRNTAAKLPNPHSLPAVQLIRTFDPANIERAVE